MSTHRLQTQQLFPSDVTGALKEALQAHMTEHFPQVSKPCKACGHFQSSHSNSGCHAYEGSRAACRCPAYQAP